MARVMKRKEDRRTELLDVVENLFVNNGYERITIGDIVENVGIAKGAFYYYFKSKDDVLNAVIQRFVEKMKEKADVIENDIDLSLTERLQEIVKVLLNFGGLKNEMIEYIHSENNMILYRLTETQIETYIAPVISRIIRLGVREGVYNTEFVEETVGLIIKGICLKNSSLKLLLHKPVFYNEKICFIENLITRILGIEEGKFILRDSFGQF